MRKVEAASVERGVKRAQSGKMKHINPATRAAQALKSNPPKVSLGMIDLSKPPAKAVLVEEFKARGNHLASTGSSVRCSSVVVVPQKKRGPKLNSADDGRRGQQNFLAEADGGRSDYSASCQHWHPHLEFNINHLVLM
jgi:hypothetical protein